MNPTLFRYLLKSVYFLRLAISTEEVEVCGAGLFCNGNHCSDSSECKHHLWKSSDLLFAQNIVVQGLFFNKVYIS